MIYRRGFNVAKSRIQECLQIILSRLESEDEQILNAYNNMGLVYGCQGDYQRGLEILGRAEDTLKLDSAKYPAKGLLLNANWSRNYYCMGKYKDAEKRLDACFAEAAGMESAFSVL
jgi:tetratricopeptide (TPR) repeat protein